MTVPDDFPREPVLSSVAGVQPKITARLVYDKYIVGLTEEELRERYEACEDLAQQLVAYCARKRNQNPGWTREFTINRTRRGLADKARSGQWDVSPAEQEWIMARVEVLFV